ncbi:MAG: hypothetical protein NC402_03935 [Prevotella sp.]|nr:hypothetical protein [Prevotella sp.]MCM1074867.1 hypothetical protein [Ruminococcus sp.]
MKKNILLSLALAAVSVMAGAQDNPNRMLVQSAGGVSAFGIDRIEEVTFDKINGPVAAKIHINSFSNTGVNLDVQRTPDCSSFMINVLPAVIAKQLVNNPAGAGSYLRSTGAPTYNQDFEGADLSGLTFEAGTEYSVVTLGIDKYGVECDVETANFTTTDKPLTGNPKVDVTFVSNTKTTITLNFNANNDVSLYYAVIGEKGTMEKQYEQFAPMFGFSNMADMVKAWGLEEEGASNKAHTFKDLNPNTEYEVYYVAYDMKGVAAPVQIFNCSTASQGGDGASVITITPGNYILADWDGQQLPSQVMTYTPNDQTWCYRFDLYTEDIYDANKETILTDLRSDPEMPIMYWFFYEPVTTDYQVNPNTKLVAIAAGKNAKGEWGEITELRFSTPASVSGVKMKLPAQRTIPARPMLCPASSKGKVPAKQPAIKLVG